MTCYYPINFCCNWSKVHFQLWYVLTEFSSFQAGHVFRIVLGYLHEIALAKQVTSPDGFTQEKETDYSRQLQQQLVLLPKHTSTLNGWAQHTQYLGVDHLIFFGSISMQFPYFAECVRLCKRWVASQLLLRADMISEEAVELVCARIYLHPAPYSVPRYSGCSTIRKYLYIFVDDDYRTALTGFLRFLQLMSSHDWATEPLFINLNDEFSSKFLGFSFFCCPVE